MAASLRRVFVSAGEPDCPGVMPKRRAEVVMSASLGMVEGVTYSNLA